MTAISKARLVCPKYGRFYLPPKELRPCGDEFQDDKFYFDSARNEAIRLRERLGLSEKSSVLDVGCGVGRLATGIIDVFGEIHKYRGLDICPCYIKWCRQFIASEHPEYQFILLDMYNERYNKTGVRADSGINLSFSDGEFDIVYLYSVFSHMVKEDVEHYVKEFGRILAPEGKVFITAFIEEGVPEMTINPENYRLNWNGALHCVRYDKSYFERMLASNGFILDHFDYEKETDGQSGLYISKIG
ncbi:MAG: hypothetical protein CO189_06440 [candidate division Zixibacteria bacterium CG_4_9_14_3_um_filter_46_8]|nr:MAG: hypothetical protein CO189_06440 [candidate division Zixibacteria bacterium CG_4_9_14_3_um_filter_46_8]